MSTDERVYETWEQIGKRLGNFSGRHARRLLKELEARGSRFPGNLKFFIGKGCVVKMTLQEINDFRSEIKKLRISA